MINQYYTSMLSEKDVIFEIFQYSQEKAKLVGAENIYDFSLGNPSVPAPRLSTTPSQRTCSSWTHCHSTATARAWVSRRHGQPSRQT